MLSQDWVPYGISLLASLLEQPLLNREKLAVKLGVSVDTVHAWTSEKRIPHFRLGHRTVRYNYGAVVIALGRFYQAPEKAWSRKLPRRVPKYENPPKAIQPEYASIAPS